MSKSAPLLVGLVSAALLALGAVGCGSESSSPTTSSDTGTGDDAAIDETGGDAAAADDTAPAPTAPNTPKIVSVIKMSGNLHVTWKNLDTGLTKVELLRKKDAGEYAVAYTYTKAATSQHDVGAYAPGTFCYQVRTTRGDLQSELSNEMCGTP